MDTLAPNSKRDINAIINEQRDAEAAGDGVEAAGGPDKGVGVAFLVAELDAGGAAAEGGLDRGAELVFDCLLLRAVGA